ncbi:MAG: response regulator [Clostridiales Family XIII bacterium]|jgi:diguanylate cyclase (GGDEF)-like protein|nr:response regulator [Clostridiales Family XIII bacterium]
MAKKILIIDDSPFFRGQLRLSLSRDYDIIEGGTGAEGLELVKKEKPDLVLLDVVMPDYSGFEICRILRDSESNNLMPIIMITSQDAQEDILIGLELGADDYVKKPFNERELLSRIKNIFKRIDRNRNANPLTGLNGNLEIQRDIQSRIAKGLAFAVIYVDLDNFKAYNDVYGFSNGDRIIVLTADILKDQVSLFGNPDDFVGHIGGDDFIMVTTPDKAEKICQEVIDEFDEKVLGFYNEEDREKGCIVTKNRKDETDTFPLMSISLAIVTNENREIRTFVEVGDIASDVKKKLKTMPGSNYFKDRRSDAHESFEAPISKEATDFQHARTEHTY